MLRRWTIIISIAITLSFPGWTAVAAPVGGNAEQVPALSPAVAPVTVVALDTSGSTTSTDPAGYARSACKMLIDLTTPGDMGLITFGDKVEAWGPVSLADPGTLAEFKARVDQVPSNGATPLAAAVEQGLKMFRKIDAPSGSALWIVSDGRPEPDTAGQEVAVRSLLPDFTRRGWHIYTVALQLTDPAGLAFLKEIALETGGSPHQVDSADQLLALFLTLFAQEHGKSLNPFVADTLAPGKRLTASFYVSPFTTEAAIVVTKGHPATRVTLFQPDNTRLSPNDAQVVTYADDPHYQLVSLYRPAPGRWTAAIEGGEGDINAHLLVTSQLRVSLLSPSARHPRGEPALLTAELREEEGGRRIIDPTMTLLATIARPGGSEPTVQALYDDGHSADQVAGDGVYSAWYNLTDLDGAYATELELQWKDIQLHTHQSFIVEPFPVLKAIPSGSVRVLQGETYAITVTIELDGRPFAVPTQELSAEVRQPGKGQESLSVVAGETPGSLTIPLRLDTEGAYSVTVNLIGTYKGVAYHRQLEIPLQVAFRVPTLHWEAQSAYEVKNGEPVNLSLRVELDGKPWEPPATDLTVAITGPDQQSLPITIQPGSDPGRFEIELQPAEAGDYSITVELADKYGTQVADQQLKRTVTITFPPPTLGERLRLPLAVVVAVALLSIIAWFILRSRRSSPWGRLVDDTGETIVNFGRPSRPRSILRRLLSRDQIVGEETDAPTLLAGLEFRFDHRQVLVRLRRQQPAPVLVGDQPLIAGSFKPLHPDTEIEANGSRLYFRRH